MFVFTDRLWRWPLAVSIVLSITCTPLWALEVPPLKGRINDLADLIHPSTEKQLNNILSQLEKTDSTQLVVLTVPTLDGDNLEDYSIRVVEQWKLGQKDIDNGALLLVAKNERKIRIEVGYGLEGKLTDLMAGRIIRNIMVPHFKSGRFDQGIIDGVSAITGVVHGEFTAPTNVRRQRGQQRTPPIFAGLIALAFFMKILGNVNRVLGAAVGGLLAPIAGALLFKTGIMGTLLLIPLGILASLLLGLMNGPRSFHRGRNYSSGFGGFSSGGSFGGFGGGGGGGFGGGGASGGW